MNRHDFILRSIGLAAADSTSGKICPVVGARRFLLGACRLSKDGVLKAFA